MHINREKKNVNSSTYHNKLGIAVGSEKKLAGGKKNFRFVRGKSGISAEVG